MQKKRRNGRTSTKASVEDEIAHLRGLDLKGLRLRWQGVFQRPAPAHLTRHLLFAVIAYRLQADRFGDLDHATRQVLDQTVAKEAGPAMSARLARFDQNVWSGRALQEVSSSWRSAVLHQCIRSLIGAVLLRTNMDISAHAISLADRPRWAIRVTSVRTRREDRSSISSHSLLILSQDLGG